MRQGFLVLTVVDFKANPRVERQLRALPAGLAIVTAGVGPSHHLWPHIDLSVRRRLMLGRINLLALPRVALFATLMILGFHRQAEPFLSMTWTSLPNWRAARRLKNLQFDLVCAHDVQSVWLANRVSPSKGIWLDLAEIAALQNESSLKWRLSWGRQFSYETRFAAKRCQHFTTVSGGLQQIFEKVFGIGAVLAPNTSIARHDLKSSVSPMGPIRLVHTGAAIPSRGLEAMIQAVGTFDGIFSLDLFLTSTAPSYRARLDRIAQQTSNVSVKEPVPSHKLVETINQYDAMLIFVQPTNTNQRYCLPNKFFDSIQARVPIISGPTPDIAEIIRTFRIGWTAKGFAVEDIIEVLGEVNREILRSFAENLDTAAISLVPQDKLIAQRIAGLGSDEASQPSDCRESRNISE